MFKVGSKVRWDMYSKAGGVGTILSIDTDSGNPYFYKVSIDTLEYNTTSLNCFTPGNQEIEFSLAEITLITTTKCKRK